MLMLINLNVLHELSFFSSNWKKTNVLISEHFLTFKTFFCPPQLWMKSRDTQSDSRPRGCRPHQNPHAAQYSAAHLSAHPFWVERFRSPGFCSCERLSGRRRRGRASTFCLCAKTKKKPQRLLPQLLGGKNRSPCVSRVSEAWPRGCQGNREVKEEVCTDGDNRRHPEGGGGGGHTHTHTPFVL